jgi:hypothetical protein
MDLVKIYITPVRVWDPMGFVEPVTRTRKSPHLWLRVRVSTGAGAGCQKKPQGNPSHSLIFFGNRSRRHKFGFLMSRSVCYRILVLVTHLVEHFYFNFYFYFEPLYKTFLYIF